MKFSWQIFFIKLTSRKLWVAIAGLVTSVMLFMHQTEDVAGQVASIIMATGSVFGYLIANGLDSGEGGSSDE